MRLLIAGIQWPPETFIARRIDALTKAGVQVTVAANRIAAKRQRPARVKLIHAPFWSLAWPLRAAHLVRIVAGAFLRSPADALAYCLYARSHWPSLTESVRWAYRLLPFAGRRADVVHFEWNFSAAEYLPLFTLSKRPCVVSCRGAQVQVAPNLPFRKSCIPALRQTFEAAAAVHCVSEAIRVEASRYGLEAKKARIIRPAVDVEFFVPAARGARPSREFRVVSVGSLIWRKGYEYALMATRRLVDRGVDVRYEIIGDGPTAEHQRVLYTIGDLGLESTVRLLGAQPPQRVRDRLQWADAYLLTSLSEGIANSALEAMACGVPVVTTDCGGMREAVADGVEGFVTPVRDATAAADALGRLAGDELLRTRMGSAARLRAVREFRLEAQAREFVSLYNDVVAQTH
jgi:colanic acid/amylovoran biosynthesis glycosyltransferase